MFKVLRIGKALLFSVAFLLTASQASAQSFVLDFKQPLFDVCHLRESCTIVGIKISAFRASNDESFIENADTKPALLHWDAIDGLGVIGGKEDDEIDPDEMITVELPAYRAIKMFRLSDLFLGSQGRDSEGGEYATIYTYNESGKVNRYDLQGGIDLPEYEFNQWDDAKVAAASADANKAQNGDAAALLVAEQQNVSQNLANGEQHHSMEPTFENRVNRIEFTALQKENNDFSIEAIEFWRTSAARFSRSDGS